MADLDKQMKKLQEHLKTLKVQADKASGEARRRMKRIERRTRVEVERALRRTEPRVRRRALASSGSMRRSDGARSSASAGATTTEDAQRLGARPAR